jgi:hypothetical protein
MIERSYRKLLHPRDKPVGAEKSPPAVLHGRKASLRKVRSFFKLLHLRHKAAGVVKQEADGILN